tara:strand:- start:328 stop:873 length:546 start_codon:yes stop_codon:yes gene_type:complete
MKLIILDRDGVINEDSDDYIKSPAEWHPIPGSLEAIAQLSRTGWRVFVASNQSGIGRGLFTYQDLFDIHALMNQRIAELGGRLEGISFAPEHPDQASEMRKPRPGMLLDIARRAKLSLEGVPFVGDSLSDIQAAQAAGARPILVRSGKGRRTESGPGLEGVPIYDDLAAYVAECLARPAQA